jgi:23S rRNA (guanosine2251-2'-O)-methyltransferase
MKMAGDRGTIVERKAASREDRSGSMWVTGRHPVEELLASATQRARKVLLSDVVSKEVRAGFEKRAKELALPCLTCPRQEWERRTGEREGGGIAAEIAEYVYAGMEEWVSALPDTARVFLLDGITDPGNLGAIVRSARAFAFDGVVLPADRSCPVTGAVFRASAGAAAHVPVVQVTNLVRAIERLQEAGFWLYAAEGAEGTDLSAFAPAKRTAIVLGSEEKGIRRLARERCDGVVRIAMAPGAESLNVSVAAGIIAYSVRKSLTSPVE